MSFIQNIENMIKGQGAGNDAASSGGLFQNIQDMITKNIPGSSTDSQGTGGLSGLSNLLGPAALGGLAGLLLTSKAARGSAAGALLAGGGAMLWNKYKNRIREANADNPDFGQSYSPPDERAARLIRALVFAAKSDGHIDEKEQQAIHAKLQTLNLGPEGDDLVKRAMQEPLDPTLIANGVQNEDEALEIFTLTCSVIDMDHFMERSYLDALAKALNIPDDVKNDIEAKIKQPA